MTKELAHMLKTSTILYAEDEKGVQEEIEEILNILFKKVYIANDGEEALALYERFKPDLILSDIKMPKLSGLDMIKKIRLSDKETSIAIMSAHTDLDFLLLATELQLLKYVVKPITKAKLNEIFQCFAKKQDSFNFLPLTNEHLLNKQKSTIEYNKQSFTLTLKELNFLLLLLKKKSIITYDEIEDILELEAFSQHAIRQFIKKIRTKLPKDYLKNVQNQGYIVNYTP